MIKNHSHTWNLLDQWCWRVRRQTLILSYKNVFFIKFFHIVVLRRGFFTLTLDQLRSDVVPKATWCALYYAEPLTTSQPWSSDDDGAICECNSAGTQLRIDWTAHTQLAALSTWQQSEADQDRWRALPGHSWWDSWYKLCGMKLCECEPVVQELNAKHGWAKKNLKKLKSLFKVCRSQTFNSVSLCCICVNKTHRQVF